MDNDVSKLRQSTGIFKWVAVAGAFAILAPVGVQAAAQNVKVTNEPTIEKINKPVRVGGTAKVKGTTNLGQLGRFGTNPIGGVMRNQQAPAAFLKGGDCNNMDNQLGNAYPSDVTLPSDGGRTIITTILITGRAPLGPEAGDTPPNGKVFVSTEGLKGLDNQPVKLLEARVDATTPNQVVDLGPGLALTHDLYLQGRGLTDDNGDCQFAVLGYARQNVIAPPTP